VAEVSVALHRSLGPVIAADAAARELPVLVRRYMDDFLADLQLPVQTRLTIILANEEAESFIDGMLFRMTINGCSCRHGLEQKQILPVSFLELSRMLATEACRNRDLFVTAPLCEAVRGLWTSEASGRDFASASTEDFRDLLLQLVQRGSGINRALGRQADEPQRGERWVSECFEWTVARPDATGIRVHLSQTQYDQLVGSQASARSIPDRNSIAQVLEQWDAELFNELGIVLPAMSVVCDVNLHEPDFRIQLNDIRLPPVAGLPVTDHGAVSFIVTNLDGEIRRNAGHFLTTENVECSLDLLRDRFPVLVDAVLDRFEILELTALLRDLLNEEVSIRDLRGVLESLLAIEGLGVSLPAFDVAWCSSWVRADLKRQMAHRFLKGGTTLLVHQLDSDLEARIAESDRYLPTPEEQRRLLTSVSKAVGESLPDAPPAVILTSADARRKFRQLIAREFPSLGVLSYQELSPDVNIQPLGKLAW
jgi:hypothetical protein